MTAAMMKEEAMIAGDPSRLRSAILEAADDFTRPPGREFREAIAPLPLVDDEMANEDVLMAPPGLPPGLAPLGVLGPPPGKDG